MDFLDKLRGLEKDSIPQTILNKVKPICLLEDFHPDKIITKNRPAAGLAKWCRAVREYAEALKVVKPKELR